MIVNVRIKDGRTTFQFASRRDLLRALGEPHTLTEEAHLRPVKAWAKWNLDDPDWQEIGIPFINKSSVSFVVNARDAATSEADLPALEEANERLRRYEQREAEAVAA